MVDADRVTGHVEGFVAGPGGRGVLGLAGQVPHPILEVLLVVAHHLDALEHGACPGRMPPRDNKRSYKTVGRVHASVYTQQRCLTTYRPHFRV